MERGDLRTGAPDPEAPAPQRADRRDARPDPRRLRGLLQRIRELDPVAAFPLPPRPRDVRSRALPGLRQGQPALRAHAAAPAQGGGPHLGPRLSPHGLRRGTEAHGVQLSHGLFPPHPLPVAGGAHRAPDPRRARPRALLVRRHRLPDRGRPGLLLRLRAARGGGQDSRPRSGAGFREGGYRRGLPDRDRRQGLHAVCDDEGGRRARGPHAPSAQQPAGHPRRRPSRLQQGASRSASAPSNACSPTIRRTGGA